MPSDKNVRKHFLPFLTKVFIDCEDRLFKALIEQLYTIKIENAIEAGAYSDILEQSDIMGMQT
jgi:hypothetical protein